MDLAFLIPQLVTGIFTLAGALGGGATHLLISRAGRKRSVRKALVTEIDTILSIIESRKYRDEMQRRVDGERFTLAIGIPDGYRIVYDHLIGEIGLLKANEAEEVVRFYMLLLAVIEDVRPGSTFSDPATATRDAYREALGLLDQAIAIGKRLTSR